MSNFPNVREIWQKRHSDENNTAFQSCESVTYIVSCQFLQAARCAHQLRNWASGVFTLESNAVFPLSA